MSFNSEYLHLPLTFLRWTISDQLVSYTDEGQLIIMTLPLSDIMDKQRSQLVKVTFNWRQVMTTAV